MKRTLITGANGFTGRHLAPLLAGQGHEVHGLSHCPDEVAPAGVHRMYGADVADLDALKHIVAAVRPHHVVHLAGIAFVAHADAAAIYRTNLVGTRELLEVLANFDQPVESVLLASSANIYGNRREGTLTEDMSPEPANDYGVSKVAMEYVAQLYRERLPITVVRPFNYIGRAQDDQFVVAKIVRHVRERAPVIKLGNLEVERDFSDVRTVVDAYARLLGSAAARGEVFNVCSGRAVSLREVIETALRLTGQQMKVEVNADFVRANEVRVLKGSPEKLERAIGPLAHVPLEETLRWMLAEQ